MSRYQTAAALIATSLTTAAWAQPVTGPYVSLGAGANFLQDEKVRENPFFPGSKLSFDTGAAGVGAVGYGLGNGFRVEVEGNFRQNSLQSIAGLGFPASAGGREQNYGAMANAIFDMDVGASWIYPYFGAGLGYSWTHLKDVNAVAPNGTYDFGTGGTVGHYAYQALFGVSLPVPWVDGLSMTAEYRFFSVVGNTSFPAVSVGSEGASGPRGFGLSRGTFGFRSDYNHSLMIGVRYELFPPAPPAPPPPSSPAPPPPPVVEARTYLVFFDWDRADLTARARQIVAEAASASQHVQTTRIEVKGYTDLSGTAAYNEKLSVRRAKSVEAELVRDGVTAGEISIHGYGESNPLVPTAPGVREPQNRRVEIVLE